MVCDGGDDGSAAGPLATLLLAMPEGPAFHQPRCENGAPSVSHPRRDQHPSRLHDEQPAAMTATLTATAVGAVRGRLVRQSPQLRLCCERLETLRSSLGVKGSARVSASRVRVNSLQANLRTLTASLPGCCCALGNQQRHAAEFDHSSYNGRAW
jgi:hypothetical protein